MNDGGWFPVDNRIINLLPKNREYTFAEAYLSLKNDIDNGAEISINGYARIWVWSRNKVRKFVEGLRTGKGHVVDNQRTGKGHEIRIIYNNLQKAKDSQRTVKGQSKDRQGTTTTILNPNTNINLPSEAVKMAEYLAEFILNNNPNNSDLRPDKKDATITRWATDIEKLNRIDKQPWKEIYIVMKWSQQDDFWKANILSGSKLRKQFNQLAAKAKQDVVIPMKRGLVL